MKRVSLICLINLFYFTILANDGRFVLNGKIQGIKLKTVNLTALVPLTEGITYNIDSVVIHSDSFSIYGSLKNPHFFYLSVYTDSLSRTSDLFFLDTGQHEIIVTYNDSSFYISEVSHSYIYHEYINVFLPFIFEKKNNKAATSEDIQSIKKTYEDDYSFRDIENAVLFDFIKTYPGSYIGFWFLYRRFLFAKSDDNRTYYQNYLLFDDEIKNSAAGMVLRDLFLNEDLISAGKKFPELHLKNIHQNAASLKYSGNTLTLIDFWATWCRPCIGAVPTLQEIYKKYNNKGFEIISISVDYIKDYPRLKKYVDSLRMNWGHYWDENGEISHKHKIIFFPTYFLLNEKGEIITRNNRLQPIIDIIEKKME